jgi:hypothetical protein
LTLALRHPTKVNFGRLKLHPFWDPLRRDPRFETIVASPTPKEKLQALGLFPPTPVGRFPHFRSPMSFHGCAPADPQFHFPRVWRSQTHYWKYSNGKDKAYA